MHSTVCMILPTQSTIRNSYAMETHNSSCMDDWADKIKEMLKTKRVLVTEMEKLWREAKAMRYE
jgi:hypothetical protein